MMTTDQDTRRAFITGLRCLARFLATHPDVPVPAYGHDITLTTHGSDAENRRAIESFAALMGAELTEDVHYRASPTFGPITYEAVAVPGAEMDAHRALMSYSGHVTPVAGDQRQVA